MSTQARQFKSYISTENIVNNLNILPTGYYLFIFVERLCPIHLNLIFEKSSWKNQVRRTGFLVYFELDFYCLPAKINFEIDFCRLKIQFVQVDFSNLIFQKSSTDG
jgi:hypothetical protein